MTPIEKLRSFLSLISMSELDAMNEFQNNGLVSDNAVELTDCADTDLAKAERWLRDQYFIK